MELTASWNCSSEPSVSELVDCVSNVVGPTGGDCGATEAASSAWNNVSVKRRHRAERVKGIRLAVRAEEPSVGAEIGKNQYKSG